MLLAARRGLAAAAGYPHTRAVCAWPAGAVGSSGGSRLAGLRVRLGDEACAAIYLALPPMGN